LDDPILLNRVRKVADNPGALRQENIRTTVRYTQFGYEQTGQTAEALSQALG
jgi:hypothetical protein